jgi:hypothetical protein
MLTLMGSAPATGRTITALLNRRTTITVGLAGGSRSALATFARAGAFAAVESDRVGRRPTRLVRCVSKLAGLAQKTYYGIIAGISARAGDFSMCRRVLLASALILAISAAAAQSPQDDENRVDLCCGWEWVTNPFYRDWHKPFHFQLIVLPPAEGICRGPTGARWACGLRARIALNEFIKRRAFRCEIREEAEAVLIRTCNADDLEINHWLVSNGWAEADPEIADADLIAAETQARQNAVGVWGDGNHQRNVTAKTNGMGSPPKQ